MVLCDLKMYALTLSESPLLCAGIVGRLPTSHRRHAFYSQLRRQLSDVVEHSLKVSTLAALAADGMFQTVPYGWNKISFS